MSDSSYNAMYISNTSECEDMFDNKPHESVSDTLLSLIVNNNEIKHPIIGIEGEWGSGKTNVIKMLENKLEGKYQVQEETSKKYIFYTYDVWGLQEDLTRRSFLENLIKELRSERNRSFFDCDFEKEKNDLTARKTIRVKKTFPRIKLFYIILLLIPAIIFLINAFENIIGHNPNAFLSYGQLKGIISLILSTFVVIEFLREYRIEHRQITEDYVEEWRSKNGNNIDIDVSSKKVKRDLRIRTFGRLMYVFQGKEIEDNERENIIEDEPSVCRFQAIFDRIVAEMKDNAILVVIFDNMDRLYDRNKLMSVWTSLHTFFAEKQYDGKVWVLVPYDRTQMSNIFNPDEKEEDRTVDEFLNKTFFTSFRIPTPILSTWKTFLNDKLDSAFEPGIPEAEKRILSIIFSNTTDIEYIKPREIIAYVNNLVSLYNQHKDKAIPLSYLALYSQYRDEIRKRPVKSILDFTPYSRMVALFNDEETLRANMGAIFYNIPKEDAIEVILNNEIDVLLRKGFPNEEFKQKFDTLSASPKLASYADEVLCKINTLKEYKLPSISKFISLGDEILSGAAKAHIASLVENDIDQFATDFSSFQDWQEYPLLNFPLRISNLIAQQILDKSVPTENDEDSFQRYYMSVMNLLKLQTKRKDLKVQPKSCLASVAEFKKFYGYLKSNDLLAYYDKTKINISKEDFDEYFKSHPTPAYEYYHKDRLQDIEMLKFLKEKKYDVSAIREYNDSLMTQTINSSPLEVKQLIYRINRIVNNKIQKVPTTTYSVASSVGMTTDVDVAASLLFMLHKKTDYSTHEINIKTLLTTKDDVNIPDLRRIIDSYLTYQELIRLAVNYEGAFPILTKLIKEITFNNTSYDLTDERKLNTGYIYENINEIQSYIFNSEDELFNFLTEFEKWKLPDFTKSNIFDVADFWHTGITQERIGTYKSFKHIYDKLTQIFSDYDAGEWEDIFNESNEGYNTFKNLSTKNLIPKDLWKTDSLAQGLKQSYEKYLKANGSLDFDLVQGFIDNTTRVAKTTLANQLYDNIDTPNGVPIDRLYNFSYLLFQYSARATSSSQRVMDALFDDYIMRVFRDCTLDKQLDFLRILKGHLMPIITTVNEERKQQIASHLSNLITENQSEPILDTELINEFAAEASLSLSREPEEELVEQLEEV